MQYAILKTEAANLVKTNICVFLKTFGHNSILNSNPFQVAVVNW